MPNTRAVLQFKKEASRGSLEDPRGSSSEAGLGWLEKDFWLTHPKRGYPGWKMGVGPNAKNGNPEKVPIIQKKYATVQPSFVNGGRAGRGSRNPPPPDLGPEIEHVETQGTVSKYNAKLWVTSRG